MMKIRIIRDKSTPDYMLGELLAYYGDDVMMNAWTVEKPWLDNRPYVSCIPSGTYDAFTRKSPSNGNVIELKDVPGRTLIQFHVGNTADDVEGCIAVGKHRIANGVSDSIPAMTKLYGLAENQNITVEIMDLTGLPERKGDEIESRTVDPAEWNMSMPVEWVEEIDEGKGLQRAKEIAENALRRSKWKRRLVIALNGVISFVANRTKIPELNHLKLKTEKDMERIKPYIKQKSTWEGVAAILGAVGLTIYPQAIVEIVAGVFVIIGGIEMWKKEAEDE